MKLEEAVGKGCAVLVGEYRGGQMEKISCLDKKTGKREDRDMFAFGVEPMGGYRGLNCSLWSNQGKSLVAPTVKKGSMVVVMVGAVETASGVTKVRAISVEPLDK